MRVVGCTCVFVSNHQVCIGKNVRGDELIFQYCRSLFCFLLPFGGNQSERFPGKSSHVSKRKIPVYKIFILELSLFRNYFKYTLIEYRTLYCVEI